LNNSTNSCLQGIPCKAIKRFVVQLLLYSSVFSVCGAGSEPDYRHHLFSTEFVLCLLLVFTVKRKLQEISHTNFYQINSHSLLASSRANCWSLEHRNWFENSLRYRPLKLVTTEFGPHFHPACWAVLVASLLSFSSPTLG